MVGVDLFPLKHIVVPKGDVFHALKSTDIGFKGFGEAYFSKIDYNEIKGWKRHNRFTLNLVVPFGAVKFVIYDDRFDSQTKGEYKEFVLSPEGDYSRLTVSPGLWMAFAGMAKGESMILDIIDDVHDPIESDKKELSEIPYNFFSI